MELAVLPLLGDVSLPVNTTSTGSYLTWNGRSRELPIAVRLLITVQLFDI